MAHYMFQAAYTPDALAKLMKNPEDRIASVTKVVEKLGGKVIGGWFCYGEFDAVLITELPDNVSAASFSVAASAGGALKANRTTPLLTREEMMQMFKKAETAGYQAPK
jgi:uncharacterized protein with GYD domain